MAHPPSKAQRLYEEAFAHQKAGAFEAAVEGYRGLLKIAPGNPAALVNLAICLGRLGAHKQALGYLKDANRALPNDWRVLGTLGACLYQLGDAKKALDALNGSLRANPKNLDAHFWAGLSLERLGQFDTAVEALTRAAGPKGENATALKELARIHSRRGDAAAEADMAFAAWRSAPERVDYNIYARFAAQRTCAWDRFDPLDRAFAAQLKRAEAHPDIFLGEPFRALGRADDRHLQLRIARGASSMIAREMRLPATPVAPPLAPLAGRPMRVGYLSANFHDHASMHLMAGVYRDHDPERVAFCCYSLGPDSDSPYRQELVARSERFHDCRGAPAQAIADLIRGDGIDLLMDLKGHTRDARIDALALRPAPVQTTFLGFPGTTGASFIDYIIVDKTLAPPEHADAYSETLAYHPVCYQPHDAEQEAALETPSRAELDLPEEGVVFSSFNRPFKIEAVRFQSWMEILKRVEGSVMWLWFENARAESALKAQAEEAGVAPERLVFGPRAPKRAHLARLRQSDLGLDTRIYNGHTTSSDLIAAGAPVLATLGNQFSSRVSGSILTALGFDELVAKDESDFVERAVALGNDRDALADLRARIAAAKSRSPFFDSKRYTRALEDLYAAMLARGPAPADRTPIEVA